MEIGININNTLVSVAALNYEKVPQLIKQSGKDLSNPFATPAQVLIEDNFAYVGDVVNTLLASDPRLQAATNFGDALGDKNYTYKTENWDAIALMAIVLRKVKTDIKVHSDSPISKVVATIPSYFDTKQKAALQMAFDMAGISLSRMITAAEAAVLACAEKRVGPKKILVCHIEKQKLIANLLEVANGKIKLLNTDVLLDKGSQEINSQFIDWLKIQYRNNTGIPVREEKKNIDALHALAGRLAQSFKHPKQLLTNGYCVIDEQAFELAFPKKELEEMIQPIALAMAGLSKKLLLEAKASIGSIDEVIILGDEQINLAIAQELKKDFAEAKPKFHLVDAVQVLAKGAALATQFDAQAPKTESLIPKQKEDTKTFSRGGITVKKRNPKIQIRSTVAQPPIPIKPASSTFADKVKSLIINAEM